MRSSTGGTGSGLGRVTAHVHCSIGAPQRVQYRRVGVGAVTSSGGVESSVIVVLWEEVVGTCSIPWRFGRCRCDLSVDGEFLRCPACRSAVADNGDKLSDS